MTAVAEQPVPPAAELPRTRPPEKRVNWVKSIPFLAVHVLCLAAIFTGITLTAVILFLVLFWGRGLFVTGAYHRYFSHRTYKTSRAFQFVLAFLAQTSAQRGVLW